mmetsp:Transcript_6368/g.19171  ORF Transcript_6368/g.19171 Transcript_6368/m.19171 type:complete len:307 (+) Transcript_6368:23-943(+)
MPTCTCISPRIARRLVPVPHGRPGSKLVVTRASKLPSAVAQMPEGLTATDPRPCVRRLPHEQPPGALAAVGSAAPALGRVKPSGAPSADASVLIVTGAGQLPSPRSSGSQDWNVFERTSDQWREAVLTGGWPSVDGGAPAAFVTTVVIVVVLTTTVVVVVIVPHSPSLDAVWDSPSSTLSTRHATPLGRRRPDSVLFRASATLLSNGLGAPSPASAGLIHRPVGCGSEMASSSSTLDGLAGGASSRSTSGGRPSTERCASSALVWAATLLEARAVRRRGRVVLRQLAKCERSRAARRKAVCRRRQA